jgi:hypothetical protein
MSDLLPNFGVKELRDFQQESVDNLLERKDVYFSTIYRTQGEHADTSILTINVYMVQLFSNYL